jgi:hypothetical protein
MVNMTATAAHDQIEAAFSEFIDWRPAPELDPFQKQCARGDRNSAALAYLCGCLEHLAAKGGATPEELADAFKSALRNSDRVEAGS